MEMYQVRNHPMYLSIYLWMNFQSVAKILETGSENQDQTKERLQACFKVRGFANNKNNISAF